MARMRRIRHFLLALVLGWPSMSLAAAVDPFVGQVGTFGFDFCPSGWAPMNGQLLSLSQNTALFSLLGTSYGGDGISTFALPLVKSLLTADRKMIPQCIALQGVFPPRP